MDKRRVRLTINGVVCGLITGESEEYMQSLADEVGHLMGQVMEASPFVTREAAALTAALSICDDSHKHADRAAALHDRVEELEVEAELWQEEKVELLKSAVDTQKDAQLAEKAARLESENTRLEEAIDRLRDAAARAQSLEDENAALHKEVDRLTLALKQSEESLKAAQEAAKAAVKEAAEAAAAAEEAAKSASPEASGKEKLGAPKRSHRNPLRHQEEMEQQGMVSFFQRDNTGE